jgi:hypothetical protein
MVKLVLCILLEHVNMVASTTQLPFLSRWQKKWLNTSIQSCIDAAFVTQQKPL